MSLFTGTENEIWTGYELWSASKIEMYASGCEMYKVGDQPEWAGQHFNVLSADVHRGWEWGANNVLTSHPPRNAAAPA